MPEPNGSSKLPYFVHAKQRANGLNRVLENRQLVHRHKALRRICSLLKQHATVPAEALYLMWLFHIQADDLTEAGVPFETVKALERQHPFLLSQL